MWSASRCSDREIDGSDEEEGSDSRMTEYDSDDWQYDSDEGLEYDSDDWTKE